jgi:hypothetical protein
MIGYRQLLAPLICSGEQIVPPKIGGKLKRGRESAKREKLKN